MLKFKKTSIILPILTTIFILFPMATPKAFAGDASGDIIDFWPKTFRTGKSEKVTVKVKNSGGDGNIKIKIVNVPDKWKVDGKERYEQEIAKTIKAGQCDYFDFNITLPDTDTSCTLTWKAYRQPWWSWLTFGFWWDETDSASAGVTVSKTSTVVRGLVNVLPCVVLEVEKVEVVSGATAISNGTATPNKTYNCAALKGSGDVIIRAVLNSTIDETDLPDNFITWSTGDPVPGHQLQRKISKSVWNKFTLTATAGRCSSATMVVYIIGANPTGTKRDGTSFSDNDKALTTGMQGPAGVNGEYESGIEIEFTIQPASLLTDADNNLFKLDDIQWDVSRDKRVRYWKRVNGTWELFDDRGASWASDDSIDEEEDNNPWDGNGHLYGNDSPGWVGQGNWLVSKLNMREWVRVGLGGVSGRNGTICSGYQYWRAFRSIRNTDLTWVNDNTYDNELEEENSFWGLIPPIP